MAWARLRLLHATCDQDPRRATNEASSGALRGTGEKGLENMAQAEPALAQAVGWGAEVGKAPSEPRTRIGAGR